jgi:NADPH2:quinone reductase
MDSVIVDFEGKLKSSNIPIPKPKMGELLIKNDGSQINPTDLHTIRVGYKDRLEGDNKYIIPGSEGVGKVIEVGDDSLNNFLGKKVVYVTMKGSWAEYAVTTPLTTFIIDEKSFHTDSQFWPSFINPITAMCMLDITRKANSLSVVQTAAFSQVGQMFIKICKLNNIKTINVVRNKAQFQALKDIGADFILDQNDPNFKKDFKTIVNKLSPSVCFECVAGDFGGLIFNIMPNKSTMYLYGSLALKPLGGISPVEMIYNEKDIKHFQVFPYLFSLGDELSILMEEFSKYYNESFAGKISKVFNYQQVKEAIDYYSKNMSQGKVLLRPKF